MPNGRSGTNDGPQDTSNACPPSERPPSAYSRREMIGVSLLGVAGLCASTPLAGSGNPFGTSTGSAERPMLDVALQAARWIRSTRIETNDGVTWPARPDPSDDAQALDDTTESSLYYGTPGVVLFYLELYYATGDDAWLDEARAGAGEMIARLPDFRTSEEWGFYTGIAGIAFVLEELHQATGEGRYRDAAERAVRWLRRDAEKTGGGVTWNGSNDIIRGSAGIGLLLLWIDRQMDDPDSRKLAAAAGRLLLERGRPAGDGLKWDSAPGDERNYPNFSHGTAGIAYFLASLYQTTGKHEFLEAAERGAAYLQSIANRSGDTFKVFHHEPDGKDLFYLGWCHGPVGTSRLFYRLAESTGEEEWAELTRRSARTLLESGIPEERTPGFWNNVGQCGGNAGVGEYFLALQRTMPDPAYEKIARRVAEDTLERATEVEGDGLKWVQAEHRALPDRLLAQTGFMQGAAGVGTFFLHLDALEQDRDLPIAWPDSPFV